MDYRTLFHSSVELLLVIQSFKFKPDAFTIKSCLEVGGQPLAYFSTQDFTEEREKRVRTH